MKLTDLSIRSLTPGVYYDDKTPAFGLRVGKNRKTWIIQKGRGRVKRAIGHYPALSLADARRKAVIALSSSPLEPQDALTFPDALQLFLAQDKWRARSRAVLESSLKHFDWKRTIDKITHEDVANALDAIKGKSARSHALKDIRAFFNWCVPRYIKASPAAGLKMTTQPTRDRVLTDDELKRVWMAAEAIGHPFGTIVRLLILTGQRRSEIGTLQRTYVHEDRITLPKEVTKNAREHTFPLSVVSAALIATALPKDGFLFRATGSMDNYNGYAFHLKQLKSASDTSDWTLHDLRRTFATGLASLNVPIHVTEKILNHVSGTTGGIVAVYQRHSYWTEQVAALKAWEDKVLSLARSG